VQVEHLTVVVCSYGYGCHPEHSMNCFVQDVWKQSRTVVGVLSNIRKYQRRTVKLWFGNVRNIPEVAMTGTHLEFPV